MIEIEKPDFIYFSRRSDQAALLLNERGQSFNPYLFLLRFIKLGVKRVCPTGRANGSNDTHYRTVLFSCTRCEWLWILLADFTNKINNIRKDRVHVKYPEKIFLLKDNCNRFITLHCARANVSLGSAAKLPEKTTLKRNEKTELNLQTCGVGSTLVWCFSTWKHCQGFDARISKIASK